MLARDLKERFRWGWKEARIPARFQDYTFAGSPCDQALIKLLSYPDGEYEGDEKDWARFNRSWFLWGGYGVGKTGLMVSQLRLEVETESKCLFVSVPDLLSELRSTYNRDSDESEQDVMERYRSVEVLALDDLGAEHVKDTGWLEDRLYQLVGHRHAEMLKTLFTSNLSPDQLGARIGERVMWRIVEMCGQENIIHVTGANLRASAPA